MSIRLVITITAVAGKGAELAQAYADRARLVVQEPGCEQFEVFRGVDKPDRLTLHELWTDQAALAAHLEMNAKRAPIPSALRATPGEREDYTYNRTR